MWHGCMGGLLCNSNWCWLFAYVLTDTSICNLLSNHKKRLKGMGSIRSKLRHHSKRLDFKKPIIFFNNLFCSKLGFPTVSAQRRAALLCEKRCESLCFILLHSSSFRWTAGRKPQKQRWWHIILDWSAGTSTTLKAEDKCWTLKWGNKNCLVLIGRLLF